MRRLIIKEGRRSLKLYAPFLNPSKIICSLAKKRISLDNKEKKAFKS